MFESLPGFRDFPPEVCAVRNHIFRVWRQTALRFAFQEYDAPVLEPLELFTQKSGEEIVGQLFNFVDKGGRAVALREGRMVEAVVRLQDLPRVQGWAFINSLRGWLDATLDGAP